MVTSVREIEAAGHVPGAFVRMAVVWGALMTPWGVVTAESSVEVPAEHRVEEHLTPPLVWEQFPQEISRGEAAPRTGPESRNEAPATDDELDEQLEPAPRDREDPDGQEVQRASEMDAKPAEKSSEVAKPIRRTDVPVGNQWRAGLLVAAVLGAMFMAMRFVLRAR